MYIFILFSSIDIQKCIYFVFVLNINLLLFENFFLKKKSQANVSLLKNFADICTGKKEKNAKTLFLNAMSYVCD